MNRIQKSVCINIHKLTISQIKNHEVTFASQYISLHEYWNSQQFIYFHTFASLQAFQYHINRHTFKTVEINITSLVNNLMYGLSWNIMYIVQSLQYNLLPWLRYWLSDVSSFPTIVTIFYILEFIMFSRSKFKFVGL